jgi:hypothetical protein
MTKFISFDYMTNGSKIIYTFDFYHSFEDKDRINARHFLNNASKFKRKFLWSNFHNFFNGTLSRDFGNRIFFFVEQSPKVPILWVNPIYEFSSDSPASPQYQ